MQEYKTNNQIEFLQGYYLLDNSVCDDLINMFKKAEDKKSPHLVEGETSTGVNKLKKDSLDLQLQAHHIDKNPPLKFYFMQLSKMIDVYKQKYKFCDTYVNKWGLEPSFNIQKYKPSQAYHRWHTERGCKDSDRHLAYMTYLNDVKEGGETEFFYQKYKFKPEKGLTLIWGTDWTFTHKGHTTKNEDKYIMTGWYEFKE